MKKWIYKSLVISMVIFTFAIGYTKSQDHYLNLQLFIKVMNLIKEHYVEKVDTKKLIYGGIKGMLRELDPHSHFLPPNIYKEFEKETSGQFGGLGIEVTIQNGLLTIISPIEDSPAWKAGLKPGDKIVSIDGHSTKDLSLAESTQMMKGEEGSKINLGIVRGGLRIKKDFVVQREIIKIKSVKYSDLGQGYGYLKLTNFTEDSALGIKKTLKK